MEQDQRPNQPKAQEYGLKTGIVVRKTSKEVTKATKVVARNVGWAFQGFWEGLKGQK